MDILGKDTQLTAKKKEHEEQIIQDKRSENRRKSRKTSITNPTENELICPGW